MSKKADGLDQTGLYEKKTITDLTLGEIDICTPINIDGSFDTTRKTIYVATAQAMSPAGPIPITTEVDGAKTLEEALNGFKGALNSHIEKMIVQAEKAAIEQSKKIITPGEAVKEGLSIVK